jgi:class 3 adenylate cyclase
MSQTRPPRRDPCHRCRRELVDPKIAERDGRIVKTTGDGLLVEFASVIDAVRCVRKASAGNARPGSICAAQSPGREAI